MTNQTLEQTFSTLGRRPVAVRFLDAIPENIAKFEGQVPAGCAFWKLAAEGRSFYTVPADHQNCPIGAYTHNVPMPAGKEGDLSAVLNVMTGLGYLKMEEVPGIARAEKSPAAVAYSPLGDTAGAPDAVIFAGAPGKLMLIEEAAIRAGQGSQSSLGRPTCMAVPAAMKHGMVGSSGCVGNRVYTGIGDGETYIVLSGAHLAAVAAEFATVANANAELARYHQERLVHLTV